MPTYNYTHGHLFLVDDVNSQAEYNSTSALVGADVTYLGVIEEGSGWVIDIDQQKRDSESILRTILFKNTVEIKLLTALVSATKTALDGKTVALAYIPATGVTVDHDTPSVTLSTGTDGKLLAPMELTVVDDYKLGTEDIASVMIKGELKKSTKAALEKTVTYAAS